MKFKRFFAIAAAAVTSAMIAGTASAATSRFVYGDLDGDGNVTISDLVKIKLYVAGQNVSNFKFAAADVNCDGAVNDADVSLMKRAVVGLVTLPVRNSIEYSFSGMIVPTTLNAGSSFNLGGSITSSGGNISYVRGEIINSNGGTVMTQVSPVDGTSLDLRSSLINTNLRFGKLAIDSYTLTYTVVGQDNSSKTVSYPFRVQSKAENENTIYNFLRNEMGYSKAAAVAVLANINAESSFNPNLFGDGGTSYGIAQWHNGRFTALKNFCANNGYDYTSLYGQLKYLQYDLTYNYSYIDRYLRSVSNSQSGAYYGAAYFCRWFERPANVDYMANLRGNSAMNTYWYRH